MYPKRNTSIQKKLLLSERSGHLTKLISLDSEEETNFFDCMNIHSLDKQTSFVAGSLFSGGGLGDVGIEWGAGVPVLGTCELVSSRAALLRKNFPETKVFEGDIWKTMDQYISFFQKKLNLKSPWLLTLSPPCQGMSSNGAGRISSSIRKGNRPREDQRNRLILPGIDILESLKPDWFVLENVRRMENTIIRNEHGKVENILDCLCRRLHPLGYSIRANMMNFQGFGVPHHRERLITIGCRIPEIVSTYQPVEVIYSKETSPFHASFSHGGLGQPPLITLRDAIGHLPILDAQNKLVDPEDPYHCIPKWNDNQYFWMRSTPEGQTAYDNDQCVKCGKASSDSSQIECACGFPLPRPQIFKSGKLRLIHGFRSSYRRMWWDKPAGTLTMNSGVISSDLKCHPEQNRVLSLREIIILSTLQHPKWKNNYSFEGIPYGRMESGENFSKKLIREVIGESIPPLAMAQIVERLLEVDPRI